MSDYLSVKEFAAAAGVSDKYIYKIKNKGLKPYLRRENKQYVIHKDALNLFSESSTDSLAEFNRDSTSQNLFFQPEVEKVETTDSTKNSTEKADEIAALHLLVEELKKDKDYLRQQIDSKDKLIDTLTSRIESDAIRLDKMQLLLDQQQKLSLVDKAGMKREDIVSGAAANETTVEESEPTEQKKGFFARLFK